MTLFIAITVLLMESHVWYGRYEQKHNVRRIYLRIFQINMQGDII